MPKFLRPLAVLLFVSAAAVSARPVFIPMCYDLPTCTFRSGTWQPSHQCMQGTYVATVYVNETGDWCLYGPVMP